MFELSQTKSQIILRRNTTFMGIGVWAFIMAIMGFRLLFSMLPFEEECTFADVFGLFFIGIWILIVLGMGVYAFVTNSKQITINNEGVICNTWFTNDFVNWSEIKDWGLSYCGQTRGEGNTYFLYFSQVVHPIKNDCKKKLKGKMIKTFVIGNDYAEVVSKIIPFCKERLDVEPFIGKDKCHFI